MIVIVANVASQIIPSFYELEMTTTYVYQFYSSAFSNFHVNTILCWLFHVRTKRFLLFGFRWVVMLRVRITICFLLRTRWRCNQRENKAENAVITLFQSITINTQTDLMTIIMIPLTGVNKSCVCYLGKIRRLSTR